MGRVVPPGAHEPLPTRAIGRAEVLQVRPEQRAELRGGEPVVGHRRLHVPLLLLGLRRVAGRCQLSARELERDHAQTRRNRSVRWGSRVSRQHVQVWPSRTSPHPVSTPTLARWSRTATLLVWFSSAVPQVNVTGGASGAAWVAARTLA